MTIILRKSDGVDLMAQGGAVDEISVRRTSKTVVHKLPMANKDLIQYLGYSNREFTIKGYTCTPGPGDFIDSALGGTGSIYFSSSALGERLNNVQIFYTDVQWQDKGSRPRERTFVLTAIEVL